MIMLTELDRLERCGGTAFPLEQSMVNGGTVSSLGMTLRDWFAGQAMVMLSAGSVWAAMQEKAKEGGFDFSAGIAHSCYQFADAMLEARKK